MDLILANIIIWDVLEVGFEIKFLNSENEFSSTYISFWRLRFNQNWEFYGGWSSWKQVLGFGF